ncbi:MAG: hypothetical protein ACLR7Z_12565 [Bilophila wadsworthia]
MQEALAAGGPSDLDVEWHCIGHVQTNKATIPGVSPSSTLWTT